MKLHVGDTQPCLTSLQKLVIMNPGDVSYSVVKADDAITLDKLRLITTACHVWLELHRNNITIYAEEKLHLKKGFVEVHKLLFVKDTGRHSQMSYLVHVSGQLSTSSPVDMVDISPVEEKAKSLRPMLLNPVEDRDDKASIAKTATEFEEAFTKVANIISSTENEMRMRIHLGIFTAKNREKKNNVAVDQYTNLEDLKAFVAKVGTRGLSNLSHNIGNLLFAKSIRDMVYMHPSIFEGSSVTIMDLKLVQPTYSLVVFAKNLRLESDVVTTYQPPVLRQARVYDYGNREKRAEIVMSCPEKEIDWQLEVLTESNTKDYPSDLRTFLENGVKFAKFETNGPKFPQPQFSVDAARRASVDTVHGRVTWTFNIRNSSYRLEVSVYHEWKSLEDVPTKAAPMSCGVSLFGQSWEDELRPRNLTGQPRDFGRDFSALFADAPNGIQSLVTKVHDIIDLIPSK